MDSDSPGVHERDRAHAGGDTAARPRIHSTCRDSATSRNRSCGADGVRNPNRVEVPPSGVSVPQSEPNTNLFVDRARELWPLRVCSPP